MDARVFLLLLLQSLIQYPQMAGDVLDEDTHLRMELRAKRLTQEMTRLLQELEQGPLERSVRAWGALLWAALQHWHLWALAGVLVLLLGLCFHRRRKSHEADNNSEEEEDNDDRSEGENNVLIVQEDNGDNGNEVGNVDANEEEGGNDIANAESDNDDGNEVEEEDNYDEIDMERILEGYTQWPTEDLERGCQMTTHFIHKFIVAFHALLSNNLYPVPQEAIGVGSAFEGWSPCEGDTVYCVLVPLIPPRGHTFHLELDTSRHIPGRNFHIRVEQVCTCTGQQQSENVRCLIHHPVEQQQGNEEPSFLNTLCTGSYLDVEKTARWFYQLVRASWRVLSESHNWHLVLLPSSRSCKFKLTKNRESFTVEMLFGVQQGDSDIFVTSQDSEAFFTPSTIWPETYAVAEVKFFRHITDQTKSNRQHLKCLHLLARALVDFGFSVYTLKTIVMHLLNTVLVSSWLRRDFVKLLNDTVQFLRCSLLEKCLDHFIVGNQSLPEVISLPPDVQNTEPLNLFHHLAQDLNAYTMAMSDCRELNNRLLRMMHHGR